MASAVRFTGFRTDATTIIAAGDLFVLPSSAEPFGLLLLEATALGLPVVATAAGGPRDPNRTLMVAALAAFTVYHVQTLLDVYWRRGVGALSWARVGEAVAVTSGAVRPSLMSQKPFPGQPR